MLPLKGRHLSLPDSHHFSDSFAVKFQGCVMGYDKPKEMSDADFFLL